MQGAIIFMWTTSNSKISTHENICTRACRRVQRQTCIASIHSYTRIDRGSVGLARAAAQQWRHNQLIESRRGSENYSARPKTGQIIFPKSNFKNRPWKNGKGWKPQTTRKWASTFLLATHPYEFSTHALPRVIGLNKQVPYASKYVSVHNTRCKTAATQYNISSVKINAKLTE